MNLKIVKKMLDFRVSHIKFALCSHVHKDHSKYINDYLNIGIKVFMPMQVKEQYTEDINAISIEPMKGIEVDGFSLTAFEVPHDKDVVCYAYILENESIGKLLYMTDCMYCKYNLHDFKINHFLCECNYIKELVNENYEKSLRNRVLNTHMELQTTKDFITANKSDHLRTVTLCHLSKENSDEQKILREVKQLVGGDVEVNISKAGLEISLSRYPF